jgi:hypothetical protein
VQLTITWNRWSGDASLGRWQEGWEAGSGKWMVSNVIKTERLGEDGATCLGQDMEEKRTERS